MAGRLAAIALLTVTVGWLAAAPAAAAPVGARGQVVVIAVPDLRWIDLQVMPALRAFAARSSVAELSVKTLSGIPRCAAGSLTFSAGNRANANAFVTGCHITAANLDSLRDAAATSKFATHIGALGQALHDAGLRTAAVGRSAIPLLADEHGAVDVQPRSIRAGLRRADVVARVIEPIYHSTAMDRVARAAETDQLLATELADIPPDVTVIVAGTSDGAATRMHLHALLIHGPGWPHRELRSPSTRTPYVQLRDLAPTILAELDVPVPSTMVGRPVSVTGNVAQSPAVYADDDDHAVTARDVGRRFRSLLAEVALAVVLLVVVGEWRADAAAAARWGARFVIGVPVGSYLAQIAPWWRWGSWPYFVITAGIGLVLGGVVALVARRSTALAVATVPAVTAAVLIVDQFAGAPLQLSAPLGDNPIVAGRFHGMGNTDFALMCTGMVVCAGLIAGALSTAGRRRLGLAIAATMLVLAIVVDAAPPLGDDFGGVLTMGPVTAVVLVLLAGVALTWRRLGLIVVGAAALAVGIALLDYARPAEHQTHVGRFVGEVLHGGAGRTVRRKLDASLQSFGNAAMTSFVVVTMAVAAVGRQRIAAAIQRVPGLPAAMVGVGIIAVLGTFLNDSGVIVATAALLLGGLSPVAAGLQRRTS